MSGYYFSNTSETSDYKNFECVLKIYINLTTPKETRP